MAACNQDQGRANQKARQDKTARREGARGFVGFDMRSKEERRADLDADARKLGVSRLCFV